MSFIYHKWDGSEFYPAGSSLVVYLPGKGPDAAASYCFWIVPGTTDMED